ncbi:AAA family ATPase [Candidatus Marinarcus aquaticus]|uniref:ATPase n=1 Tax=Candidatus Marinarcus aquaticus TaxID=2044504 RepID=A0A4V1LPA4_9BACT|nr:MoxR family ATPase [Candidatus Marinarcus aquaticus]RXJ60508.1 ATPase [Candidatus Marinarcus aquaticus]
MPQHKIQAIKEEISKAIIGQEAMIDALLIGLLSSGHVLLEGVPGLAKTTTVKALANALALEFKRVQFTPDLIPSDIIGAQIYNMKTTEFSIKKGPIFTNLLLADEINRAPAKVQSALLEVMQEKQATIAEESFKIQEPFLVLATQNPIEQEGAYALPEAQLDRFMFKIVVGYNTKEEEHLIATKASQNSFEPINAVLTHEELQLLQNEVQKVHMDKELESYILDIIFATREPEKYGLAQLKEQIQFGASPRATIDMFKAVKAKAFIRGNEFVTPVDIALVIKDVLRHRIILSYEAEAMNVSTDKIIDTILQTIPVP